MTVSGFQFENHSPDRGAKANGLNSEQVFRETK
jgi:hypothetical protein